MVHEVYIDAEADTPPEVDRQIRRSVLAVLEEERVDVPCIVEVCVTDDEGIRRTNLDMRGVDRPTDVLSFPMLTYDSPSDFSCAETEAHGCFHPDTGELLLGDIIISMEKVREQAKKYGHSEEREYAFLIAHSMLHLCGYDHMEPEEAKEMEDRQSAILRSLNILR